MLTEADLPPTPLLSQADSPDDLHPTEKSKRCSTPFLLSPVGSPLEHDDRILASLADSIDNNNNDDDNDNDVYMGQSLLEPLEAVAAEAILSLSQPSEVDALGTQSQHLHDPLDRTCLIKRRLYIYRCIRQLRARLMLAVYKQQTQQTNLALDQLVCTTATVKRKMQRRAINALTDVCHDVYGRCWLQTRPVTATAACRRMHPAAAATTLKHMRAMPRRFHPTASVHPPTRQATPLTPPAHQVKQFNSVSVVTRRPTKSAGKSASTAHSVNTLRSVGRRIGASDLRDARIAAALARTAPVQSLSTMTGTAQRRTVSTPTRRAAPSLPVTPDRSDAAKAMLLLHSQ